MKNYEKYEKIWINMKKKKMKKKNEERKMKKINKKNIKKFMNNMKKCGKILIEKRGEKLLMAKSTNKKTYEK